MSEVIVSLFEKIVYCNLRGVPQRQPAASARLELGCSNKHNLEILQDHAEQDR
jgi:hypothetical protein